MLKRLPAPPTKAPALPEKDAAVAAPPSPVETPLPEFALDNVELTAEELAIVAADPTAGDDVFPQGDE